MIKYNTKKTVGAKPGPKKLPMPKAVKMKKMFSAKNALRGK